MTTLKRLSNIPRERYKEEHYKLWMWLAEHPDKEKEDYFKDWFFPPIGQCFACEANDYAELNHPEETEKCNFCPLDKNKIGCNYDNGLYRKWKDSHSPDERTSLALQIANLVWEDKN